MLVVVRPPADARVQPTDQRLLRQALTSNDQVMERLLVSFDGGCVKLPQFGRQSIIRQQPVFE